MSSKRLFVTENWTEVPSWPVRRDCRLAVAVAPVEQVVRRRFVRYCSKPPPTGVVEVSWITLISLWVVGESVLPLT